MTTSNIVERHSMRIHMTVGLYSNAVMPAVVPLPRESMKALVKSAGGVSVEVLAKPKLADARSVVIRVTLAGLCRTDLYAAEGKFKVKEPLVLGHEFCGIVDEIGSDVANVRVGQRVTVNPLLPCRNCHYCGAGRSECCQHSSFLGIDLNGCFAGFICVPARAVYALPNKVSDLAAAYAEPVAASLAVLKAGIQPWQRGMIYGQNRFSQLLQQILAVHGINNVDVFEASSDEPPEECGYDYVVETMMNADTFSNLAKAVRPGGKIILKSRQHLPVPIVMTDLLKKEPVMHVVNYGSFEEALELLIAGKVKVDDLVDGIYSLDQYQTVMKNASRQEALKPFFAPWQG
jgi:L-iditol 2-dehydrogenase